MLEMNTTGFELGVTGTRKATKNNSANIDLVVPFMTLLQVFFYLAWIKVGEEMLHPLGEGESDFESNYIIDRNLSYAMLMADSFAGKFPKQLPDCLLPLYSKKSAKNAGNEYVGSVSTINFDKKIAEIKRNQAQGDISKIHKSLMRRFSAPPSRSRPTHRVQGDF
uniref:Bestrophin homolog n=1 Tax=Ditylenchus dipsaci TaxID=166011 RepID=A0A915CZM2_9BILA